MPARPVLTALLIGGLFAACHSTGSVAPPATIVQPGAPGQPSRSISAADASDLSQVRHTAADVAFMQGMIAHHAQALEMTALLRTRTERDDMRRMAERIELSQSDEIGMMRAWLRSRGEAVPDEHAHHAHDLMPGMLTAEQMERLAAARSDAFDRLFLEGMIAHHEGALAMVAELMRQPGAGQASDVFEFVADVEADQRMEIARMAAMLQELSR
jgi:uncharacterized protein (DUF305 family)